MDGFNERSSDVTWLETKTVRCPCCSQLTDELIWRHDRFARRLLAIWKGACRDRGICFICAETCCDEVVHAPPNRSTFVTRAANAFEHLMRFTEPVQACMSCDEIDLFMEREAVEESNRVGASWFEHRFKYAGFSATRDEIASCVIGPDGQFRGYKNEAAIAKYHEILLKDRFSRRTDEARRMMPALARRFYSSSRCPNCLRMLAQLVRGSAAWANAQVI